MDYLIEGEELTKIRAGFSGLLSVLAADDDCGGNDVYCKSDADCGKWSQCVHPTTYGGCKSGVLTYEPEV